MVGRSALRVVFVVILTSVTFAASAQSSSSNWFLRTDIQGFAGANSGTTQRDALYNLGIFVRADYLERGGVTFGYNRTELSFEDSSQDISQDNLFLSGRWQMTPDWAQGQLTVRLDGHVISNDDVTGETDDVTAVAPQVTYLNFNETFYMDLGFARTSYGDSLLTSETLEVDQLTPTLGLGFNDNRDWLQLRAYLIDTSNAQRSHGEEDTAALELKWTHWVTSPAFLNVDNFRLSALIGERIFAVDPDAGSVYNLNDLQTGGASIGAEWAPSEQNRVLLLVGVEQFENRSLAEDYRNAFVYLNFSHLWE